MHRRPDSHFESVPSSRRRWLRDNVALALVGGMTTGMKGWLGSPGIARAHEGADQRDDQTNFTAFDHYDELLKRLQRQGRKFEILTRSPDRSPLVAVRTGGDKQPGIVISAGAHSTEHAGVVSAVELVERLQTDHETWILPCRDPIGLNGYAYALELGGVPPEETSDLKTLDDLESLLRRRGEVLVDADGLLLVVIGEYGYANRGLYRKVEAGSPLLDALRGRRIYYPTRSDDMPGNAPMQRAYTLVVTPQGEVLHLNRFHDAVWAPAEVRAIRGLMARVRPGLTFDLHEYEGDAFWLSARRQRTSEDELWERRMAAAAAGAVAATGAKMAPETYSPGSFFERLQEGVYWLDASQRGEGLNLVDFAAHRYGPGFTIETGMRQPLADRVRQHLLVVQTAVRLFEQRHA